ncbi:hypothetical protein ACLOJK_028233, partial [Asimina triloba]
MNKSHLHNWRKKFIITFVDKDDDGRQATVYDGTNVYGDGIDGLTVALHGDADSDDEPIPPSPFHYIEN